MTRTKITAHDDRRVTIAYTSLIDGETVQLDIWAPQPGPSGSSYVRFNGNRQLCAGLSSGGHTLSYREGTRLVDLVRKEYRAMRADEKREAARYGY
jgi:hypothetical protein